MGVFFWLIFIGAILINPRDKRRSDLIKVFVLGGLALSILTGLLVSGVGPLALIALGIYALIKGVKKRQDLEQSKNMGQTKQQRKEYTTQWKQQQEPQYKQYQKERETARKAQKLEEKTTLPSTVKKRRKILESFNLKYDLLLTKEQQESIVNASYLSKMWRIELEDMNHKYNSVYEWFQGPTSWVRVYLYAFHVQEVSSDFMQQENITTHAFESIFRYVDTLQGMSMSEQIRAVNDKFFTSFDDVSFMIAYRFLESRGYKHELSTGEVLRNEETVDELLQKYAPMESEE